ncbi:MAG: hypothetical protein GF330_05900 [Candidatus Eisenbacteria bacterium]|nr:hypothetical protein [Candidatus Eisenbacteria bacterium]
MLPPPWSGRIAGAGDDPPHQSCCTEVPMRSPNGFVPALCATLLLTVCACVTPVAGAAILHVPGDYPTIQAGIDAAAEGDVVMVAADEYFEEISLKAGVVVQGAGEGLSIISGGGDSGDVVSAIGNDIDHGTRLTGFTITGAISGGGMPGGGGIFCNSGASPEICNCRLEGNDFGIATWNGAEPWVHNNVIVHNTYTGFSISSRPELINNTISYNDTGIYDSGGYRPPIMNNIVTHNTTRGIGCTNNSVPTDFSYNDVWGNGQDYYNCNPGPGDISEDPLFVDAGAGDYHLGEGSPCIDAGNPDPAYNDPDGTRNDMGAYGGPGADLELPAVSLTVPSAHETAAPRETDATAVFTVEMDPATLSGETFLLRGDQTGFHDGLVTYDAEGQSVTLDPDIGFRAGERVTALLTTDVASAGGQPLGGHGWQFQCAADDGSGEFETLSDDPLGESLMTVATADFDGDGHLDLAIAGRNRYDVVIRLGLGDGSFSPATFYPAGGAPWDLVAGDFDRDGALDLAAACPSTETLSILLGLGDGSFAAPTLVSSSGDPSSLACGDLDADGDLDLVATQTDYDNCAIFLGDGAGGFTYAAVHWSGLVPLDVEIGDLDADGALDIAVATSGENAIGVLLGAGDGTFGAVTHYPAGITPSALQLGDFDQDGAPDAAAVNMEPCQVSILCGDGSGGFGSPQPYPVGEWPRAARTFDANADGHLDLAVTNSLSGSVSVLLGRGDGSFDAAVAYPSMYEPSALTSGDFDEDGDLDLAVVHDFHTAYVSILRNKNALAVVSTDPGPFGLEAPAETDVTARFDAPLDPYSLNAGSFLLAGAQSGPHPATVTYEPGVWGARLDPQDGLRSGEMLTATLTPEVTATNGVHLSGYVWSFTAEVFRRSYGVFEEPLSCPAGNDPRGVAAADFDRDGDIDLAVCVCGVYPQPGSVALLINQGNGSFAAPQLYSLGAPDPLDIFAADLNGDLHVDLAVAHNEPGSSHLVVLRNQGDGSFAFHTSYTPAILGQALCGGDFDADGDVDLVMTDGWGSGDNVKVLRNDGTGAFPQTRVYSAGSAARGVAVADIDLDGDLDIGVVNSSNDNVSLLLNDGRGEFPGLRNCALCDGPSTLCINDLNGDGAPDIAGAGSDAAVILNLGDGSFGPPESLPEMGAIKRLVWADVDGDGDCDLAGSMFGDEAVWVTRNQGHGSFPFATTYAATGPAWGLSAADFDGDGTLDLAAASYDLGQVDLLFNLPSADVADREPVFGPGPPGLGAYPNPFRGATKLVLRVAEAEGGHAEDELPLLRIHDVGGRLVRTLPLQPGPHGGWAIWDGCDRSGHLVPQGVFYCRTAGADASGDHRHRLVHLR